MLDGIGLVDKVWIGYALDQEIRLNAASGGIITGSLIGLLENGTIDGAVVNVPDSTYVPHGKSILAKTKEDILFSAKSLYCMTEIKRGLNIAKWDDSVKKLAVVGLPCQIADLRKSLKNDSFLADKIKICFGIMCGHNILSKATIEALNQSNIDLKDVKEIRYRAKGWFPFSYIVEMIDGQKKEFPWSGSSLQKIWDSLKYQPKRCLGCLDFAAEDADIACCDAWLEEYRGNQEGYSIVLTHTKKGTSIIEGLIEDNVLNLNASDVSCLQRSNSIQINNKLQKKNNVMNILFCGPGYGAGNIGDDAILSGVSKLSRMYLPKETKYGAVVFNEAFTKEWAGVDEVFQVEDEIEKAFEWATHIVLGGATLIGRWGIAHCAPLIRLAHKLKKPICMLGVGATDQPSEDELVTLRETFGSLDMITVRSEADKKLAISYGISSKKLWICADCAFAIDCHNIIYNPKDTFGINLVNENLPKTHSYMETIRKFLIGHSKSHHLTFICGEARKKDFFDYTLLEDLYKQFHGDFVCEHFLYPDFLRVLASCKVVLTMRMHMVIFCSLIGVPCIPLVRERKTLLMANSLGLSRTLSLDEDSFDFNSLVSDVLAHPEKALADKDKVADLIKRSFTNGLMLKKWIKKTL